MARNIELSGDAYRASLIFALLAMLSAFVGLGWSHSNHFPADDRQGAVAHDGWISNGAVFRVEDSLLGRRAIFHFDPWRPPGIEPAVVTLSACGRSAGPLTVSQESKVLAIAIPLGCDKVSVNVANPFRPSPADKRELAVKLERLSVRTPLGFPLPAFDAFLFWSVLVFVLAVVANLALRSLRFGAACSFLVPLSTGALLSFARPNQLPLLEHLMFLTIAVLSGVVLARAAPDLPRRPASREKAALLLFAFAFLGGTAIRVYGLDFGFPMLLHPDGVRKVRIVQRMLAEESWNPKYFLHPSLLLYLTICLHKLFSIIGVGGDAAHQLALAGRSVSAIAGSISIVLLYRLGSLLFTPLAGAIAATLLAFSPLHVTCSRYFKEDALFLALFLAAVLAIISAVKSARPRLLLGAGFLVGLTAGAKYTGVLAVVPLAVAPWLYSWNLRPDWRFFRFTLLAAVMVPFGFLAVTPYAFLTPAAFLAGVSTERSHALTGHDVAIDAWSQFWMYHVANSIMPGLTVPVALVAFVGFGLLLGRRSREALTVVFLVLLFYLPAEWIKAKPPPQPERYILPCVPFLALCVAQVLGVVARFQGRVVAVLLAALVLIAPIVRTMQLASELRYDTRQEMVSWIERNVPQGSKILIESRYAPRLRDSGFEVRLLGPRHYHKTLTSAALERSDFDYLLVTSLSYDRYLREPSANPIVRSRFRHVFSAFPLAHEVVPRSGTYGFHNPTVRLYKLR